MPALWFSSKCPHVPKCVLSCFGHVRLLATLWTTTLLSPWDSLCKNARVGCHAPLQGIFPTQGSNPCFLRLLHYSGVFTTEPPGKPPLYPSRPSVPHRAFLLQVRQSAGLILSSSKMKAVLPTKLLSGSVSLMGTPRGPWSGPPPQTQSEIWIHRRGLWTRYSCHWLSSSERSLGFLLFSNCLIEEW